MDKKFIVIKNITNINKVEEVWVDNRTKSNQNLPKGWQRYSCLIKISILDKIKEIAFYKKITIKELIDEALSDYIKKQ